MKDLVMFLINRLLKLSIHNDLYEYECSIQHLYLNLLIIYP